MERKSLTMALAPEAGCLPLEQLGRYADGALPADEQATAAAHVRGCLNCQAEIALLQAVTSDTARAGEAEIVREGLERLERRASPAASVGRGEAPFRRRWLSLGAAPLAAAVILAAAATFYLRRGTAPDLPPGVTTDGEVTRSLAIAVRGPIGDQAEPPARLEWQPVKEAVRYHARLLEVDRREVWSTSTADAGVDVPGPIRASMAPGRTLLWEVTAYDGAGGVLAESGPQSFRLVVR
jgi:hypothetical protein